MKSWYSTLFLKKIFRISSFEDFSLFFNKFPHKDRWKRASFELSSPSYSSSFILLKLCESSSGSYFIAGPTYYYFLRLNSQANCQKFLGACSFLSSSIFYDLARLLLPINFSLEVDLWERSSSEGSDESETKWLLRMYFLIIKDILFGIEFCHWLDPFWWGYQLTTNWQTFAAP